MGESFPSMMILVWVVVSLYIVIANTVDGDCSMAFDEYYMGMRKCCDGKFEYYTCFNCKYHRSDCSIFVSKNFLFCHIFVYNWQITNVGAKLNCVKIVVRPEVSRTIVKMKADA